MSCGPLHRACSSAEPRLAGTASSGAVCGLLSLSLVASLALGCGGGSNRTDAGPLPDAAVDAGPREDGGSPPDAPAGDAETDADTDPCACAPGAHNDRIFVLSDDAELWSYDPMTDAFELVTPVRCGGSTRAFSMAVDALGLAWMLFADTEDIFTIDVNDPGVACLDPGYVPGREGFGLFGMSFATDTALDACADLYMFSYSGDGPFREGPDLGQLGALDPDALTVRTITSVDFDGGELAGTGDGRLFAFAGDEPSKLIEYDKDNGEVLDVTELPDIRRTNANAFSFFAGDAWFFTEAPPALCPACLEAECPDAWTACQGDEVCLEQLQCAQDAADVTDECGGLLSAEMMSCLSTCTDECLVSLRARVSRVTRFDFDGTEGGGATVVVEEAPIRVVGAGASTCVTTSPF